MITSSAVNSKVLPSASTVTGVPVSIIVASFAPKPAITAATAFMLLPAFLPRTRKLALHDNETSFSSSVS